MKWSLVPAARFGEQAGQWQAMNAASLASPLLEPDFVAPLLTHFGSGGELLATCRADGKVVAMALLVRRRAATWETFQPSQAPIGLWMQLPGQDSEALARTLLRALPGAALVLSILEQDPHSAPRPADSAALATMDYIDTARVTVAGSFAHYWQGRGKNLRANLKKQRARLEREGTATALEEVRDGAGVAAAIADYGRLESTGWKGENGTAVHAGNAQGAFYRELFERFCATRRAVIYRYRFNGQLVAMDLCLECDGTLIILKTAYDESVGSALSPTLLMREEQFARVFDGGAINLIEFFGKVMEWHLRWTDEVRRMYHTTAYRWPLLPALIRRAQSLKQTIRPTTP